MNAFHCYGKYTANSVHNSSSLSFLCLDKDCWSKGTPRLGLRGRRWLSHSHRIQGDPRQLPSSTPGGGHIRHLDDPGDHSAARGGFYRLRLCGGPLRLVDRGGQLLLGTRQRGSVRRNRRRIAQRRLWAHCWRYTNITVSLRAVLISYDRKFPKI